MKTTNADEALDRLKQGNERFHAVARRSARINAERLIAESDIIRAATEESGVRIVTAFFHFPTARQSSIKRRDVAASIRASKRVAG